MIIKIKPGDSKTIQSGRTVVELKTLELGAPDPEEVEKHYNYWINSKLKFNQDSKLSHIGNSAEKFMENLKK